MISVSDLRIINYDYLKHARIDERNLHVDYYSDGVAPMVEQYEVVIDYAVVVAIIHCS